MSPTEPCRRARSSSSSAGFPFSVSATRVWTGPQSIRISLTTAGPTGRWGRGPEKAGSESGVSGRGTGKSPRSVMGPSSPISPRPTVPERHRQVFSDQAFAPLLASGVRESSGFDREYQPDRRQGRGHRRAPVREKRQGNAGRRKEADHHSGVQEHRKEETRGQAEHQEGPAAVARVRSEPEPPQDDRRVEGKHGEDPQEAPFLREHGEDEIGMTDRQEAELALRAAPVSLPDKAARADRDLRLAHLVTGARNVRVGMDEGRDPLLLVVLQEEPSDRARRDERGREQGPVPGAHPAEIHPDEQERQEREREAEIGLEEDEQAGDEDHHEELHERHRAQPPVLLVLEEIRDEER